MTEPLTPAKIADIKLSIEVTHLLDEDWRSLANRLLDSHEALRQRADAGVLPKKPSREVRAAMAEAFEEAHRERSWWPSIAPDFVTGQIYAAIRAALPAAAAKDEVR